MTKVKMISGNVEKNNGGVAAGLAADRSNLSAVTHAELNKNTLKDNNKTPLAVSPSESGTYGSVQPLSGGVYNDQEEGKYLLRGFSTRIAQTDNNVLAGGDSKTPRDMLRYFTTYHRYDIVAIDVISSGTVVYGANQGTAANPVDISTGSASKVADAKPTRTIPGEFTYRSGSLTPVNDDYGVVNDTLADL